MLGVFFLQVIHFSWQDLTFQSAREYFVAQHPVQGPNGEARPDQDEWRSLEAMASHALKSQRIESW